MAEMSKHIQKKNGNPAHRLYPIPPSRIPTFDVVEMGIRKHHVCALLEFDVSDAREHLKEIRKSGIDASFLAWVLKVIAKTLEQHPEIAGFLINKRKLVCFQQMNISLLVEKEVQGVKVPLPLLLIDVAGKSLTGLSEEIKEARKQSPGGGEKLIGKKADLSEKMYRFLPRLVRLAFWRYLLRHPFYAYRKMGNVAVTSLSNFGSLNAWFIHKSVHPVSFGIGSVLKKPMVVNNEIKIREVLHLTVLLDHDAADGAPMARFLKSLGKSLESGLYID